MRGLLLLDPLYGSSAFGGILLHETQSEKTIRVALDGNYLIASRVASNRRIAYNRQYGWCTRAMATGIAWCPLRT